MDDKNAQIRRLNNKVGLQKEIIKGALDKIRVSLQQDDLDSHTLQSLHDALDKESSEVQNVTVPLFDHIMALKANQEEEEKVEMLLKEYLCQSKIEIMELKGLIAKAKSQSSLVASVSSTADAMVGGSVATRGGGYFGYFNKKSFPVFSGKYRD